LNKIGKFPSKKHLKSATFKLYASLITLLQNLGRLCGNLLPHNLQYNLLEKK
jgi:hypothetical protein